MSSISENTRPIPPDWQVLTSSDGLPIIHNGALVLARGDKRQLFYENGRYPNFVLPEPTETLPIPQIRL